MVSKESVSEIFLPDEVYVVVGEKGTKQTSPRERGLKKRDEEPPVSNNRIRNRQRGENT